MEGELFLILRALAGPSELSSTRTMPILKGNAQIFKL